MMSRSRGADHAGGDGRLGVLEQVAERVADGDRPLAHHQVVAVAQRGRRQPAPLDPQHGQVVGRRAAEHLGRELASVGQRDRDLLRFAHHVLVRQDEPGRVHDHARPQPRDALRLLGGRHELVEERVAEQPAERVHAHHARGLDAHRHDRGAHALGGGADHVPPRGRELRAEPGARPPRGSNRAAARRHAAGSPPTSRQVRAASSGPDVHALHVVSSGYRTCSRHSPCAGAVGPAAERSSASSTARIRPAGSAAALASSAVPTMLRTM